jgi:hypothetical protein
MKNVSVVKRRQRWISSAGVLGLMNQLLLQPSLQLCVTVRNFFLSPPSCHNSL